MYIHKETLCIIQFTPECVFPFENVSGARKEGRLDATGVRKEGSPKVYIENAKSHFFFFFFFFVNAEKTKLSHRSQQLKNEYTYDLCNVLIADLCISISLPHVSVFVCFLFWVLRPFQE